jgi:endonuclease YncB( thermonuclease family)
MVWSGRRAGAVAAIGAVLMTPVPALAVTADRPAVSLRCAETRGHHDGDTFTCVPESGDQVFIVRVASIDAPETGQAYWRAARARLRELAAPGSTVACYKVDRFQRQVCRLKTTDGRDVADVMLSEGLAWYPEDFSAEDVPSDRERYRRLQREAQAAKRGLWVVPDPMPPKECRQRRRTGLSCEHRETTEGTE